MHSARFLSFVGAACAAVFASAVACGGTANGTTTEPDAAILPVDGGAPDGADPDAEEGPPKIRVAGKVDILLVVDNSASMADKSNLLASSLPKLLTSLASTSDVHLGVIGSSLGTLGGDVCPETGDTNLRAHLSTRGADRAPLASAAGGFLRFTGGAVEPFIADAQSLVRGMDQTGCGLEAQLEATYRFLVQPEPPETIAVKDNKAALVGVDGELLAQRAAFLRPDSLVLVLMITDEDDSIADPLSVGGQGWAFMSNQFPGSTVYRGDGKTTTAPRASSACATDPGSEDCTSCGLAATCNPSTPACQKLRNDPECLKNGGYYGPAEDQLNVRFHRMKQRFGIDPQYPVARYVDGFTRSRVPSRDQEHAEKGGIIGPYGEETPTCVNPLFAAKLPSGPGEELCNLDFGTRGRDLVVFGLLGGVPPSLVSGASPSWNAVLGKDPLHFAYEGIDPHMIQSTVPRPGLAGPSSARGDNGTDPVHGREYTTNGDDLQYACTFDLPAKRNCTANNPSCDCARADIVPPLCSAVVGEQVKGKAYPTIRELEVARALGDRAVVGSVCEGSSYDAFVTRVADRIVTKLSK